MNFKKEPSDKLPGEEDDLDREPVKLEEEIPQKGPKSDEWECEECQTVNTYDEYKCSSCRKINEVVREMKWA